MKKGVGMIIRRKDGKILLQLRDRKKGISNSGKWSFFGGGVEKGEDSRDAAVRELKEELELSVKKEDLKKIFFNPFSGCTLFLVKIDGKEKMVLHEGRKMRFFSKREILHEKNFPFLQKLFLLFC